jgi:protein-S-isoprenylcysteine O-methyltransferase Ste14
VSVDTLRKRALGERVAFGVVLAGLLLLPAGTVRFWQAWLYWLIFTVCSTVMSLYFLRHDRALVERRMRAGPLAETVPREKVIQTLTGLLACAVLAVPGLEHRVHPGGLPVPVVLGANVLVVASFAGFFLVLRENTWAASTVQVAPGQRVIATGPYAVVRHPMYAAGMVIVLATPLALGSRWAVVPAVALCAVIVMRLLDEERYLSKNLPGYDAYRRTVRWRLIPFVW